MQAFGGGFCRRKRYGQNGVCPDHGFIFGIVDMAHDLVDEVLFGGVDADNFGRNDFFDRFYGFLDAFSAKTAQVFVAHFDGLVDADRSPRRHAGAGAYAVGQTDFDFDRRDAAGVEYFSRKNFNDFSHFAFLMYRMAPKIGTILPRRAVYHFIGRFNTAIYSASE